VYPAKGVRGDRVYADSGILADAPRRGIQSTAWREDLRIR
jgi:hypothetical protein